MDAPNPSQETPEPVTPQTRWLAWVCRLCPFCICARRWPNSGYARFMAKAEKDCPACRAYQQVYGPPKS